MTIGVRPGLKPSLLRFGGCGDPRNSGQIRGLVEVRNRYDCSDAALRNLSRHYSTLPKNRPSSVVATSGMPYILPSNPIQFWY
jgi:hypothetical protein